MPSAVERHGNIRFFVADPCDYHRANRACGGGKTGGRKDFSRPIRVITLYTESGAAVEAEPCKPQDKDTEGREWDAVPEDRFGFSILAVFADTGAEDFCADERRYAAHHMNRRGTRKIVEAES